MSIGKSKRGLVTTSQSLTPFPSPMSSTPVFSCLRPAVTCLITQGLENYCLWAKSSLWPLFVNEVLLKHHPAHVFTYCIWMLSCPVATKPKLLSTWILAEKMWGLLPRCLSSPDSASVLFSPCWVSLSHSCSFAPGPAYYTGQTSRWALLWRRVSVC